MTAAGPAAAKKAGNFLNLCAAWMRCEELGIRVITTSSAESKGRIERVWNTTQDRLVPELRLNGITSRRGIKPFAVGRRNWLFSDTPAGAAASAPLYSLIESAKANKVEPYAYLKRVFTEIPKSTSVAEIAAILSLGI